MPIAEVKELLRNNQTKENLGQYILNPLLYIEGTIARDVRGDKE